MSYQLSATPDMDIPASERTTEPRKYMYAYAATAFVQGQGRIIGVTNFPALPEEAAKEAQKLTDEFATVYRECDGCLDVRYNFVQITDAELAKLGYHR